MAGDADAEIGVACRNGGFTPDVKLYFACAGLTSDACCELGGRLETELGEEVCRFDFDANATQLTMCEDAGGSEAETSATCETRLSSDFSGEAWCQRRACEHCGHSWADQLNMMGAESCCGGEGHVCQSADEGNPADWCATPSDWDSTFVRSVNCRGISQTDCCDAGGNYDLREHDTCGALCRFNRERTTDDDPLATCTGLGGSAEQTETCTSLLEDLGTFPGVDQCDERHISWGDNTYSDIASYVGSMCCGQTASNVCSSGSGDSSPSEDLCQVASNYEGSAVHSVTCMGIDEAACATLHEDQCADAMDSASCFERGHDAFEAEDDEGGCSRTRCQDVMSFDGLSADERCVTAEGRVDNMRTCDEWTQSAVEHLGPFGLFAESSAVRPQVDCGGYLGSDAINFHLFTAGRACCSDFISQCMGLDVHVVRAEMTLAMTIPDGMSEEQLANAMRESIAQQTGVGNSSVGNINITVKVVGTAPMVVADPAAFVASAGAKLAVEAGLADQVGVPAPSVSAILSLAGETSSAPASASAPAPASAPGPAPSPSPAPAPAPVSARRLAEQEPERRLEGTVNVDYEILADLASSGSMTADLESGSGAALLTDLINEQLENVTGIDPVTVQEILAEPQVTISYEIRTTDGNAAQLAQEVISAAAGGGTAQTDFLTAITEELAEAGLEVTISGMTGTVEEVQTEETGEAATTRTIPSSSAFSLTHRYVATAAAAAVAVASAQVRL